MSTSTSGSKSMSASTSALTSTSTAAATLRRKQRSGHAFIVTASGGGGDASPWKMAMQHVGILLPEDKLLHSNDLQLATTSEARPEWISQVETSDVVVFVWDEISIASAIAYYFVGVVDALDIPRAVVAEASLLATLPEPLRLAPVFDLDGLSLAARGADAMFAERYADLRRLASSMLRGNLVHSEMLDSDTLAHETYLRYINNARPIGEDRDSFLAYASRIMRSVLVDEVRAKRTGHRRGDDVGRNMALDQIDALLPAGDDALLQVIAALETLARAQPRLAEIVEMRYFGGYSETEVAEALELNVRTVRRDWDKARALLSALLKG